MNTYVFVAVFIIYCCGFHSLWIFYGGFTDTVGGCVSIDLLSFSYTRILLDCCVFSGPVGMQVFGLVLLCSVNISLTAHLCRLCYNEAVIL